MSEAATHPTFFSQVKHRYLALPEDGRIETQSFLAACNEIIPFFDVLGSTAFAPVKSDINGNITKLTKKYDTNPTKYHTLQGIVEDEMEAKSTKAKGSATDALLWLKRALTFIRVFFEQVLTRESDLSKCVTKAYEDSLKRYHGWMVQKIFAIAMRAVPYRKDFIIALALGDTNVSEDVVMEHMQEALTQMSINLDHITKYYLDNALDEEKKV